MLQEAPMARVDPQVVLCREKPIPLTAVERFEMAALPVFVRVSVRVRGLPAGVAENVTVESERLSTPARLPEEVPVPLSEAKLVSEPLPARLRNAVNVPEEVGSKRTLTLHVWPTLSSSPQG
jgi:hypothetical protein